MSTYPTSDYDLGEVLTSLATGEAIVTVMNEKGAPTPVAWTRLRAPQGSMEPMPSADLEARVAASPLLATYGTRVDPDSAHEMLARRMEAAAAQAAAADAREAAEAAAAEAEKEAARAAAAAAKQAAADAKREAREHATRAAASTSGRSGSSSRPNVPPRPVGRAARRGRVPGRRRGAVRQTRCPTCSAAASAGSIAKEVVQGIFSTLRRRR